MTDLEIIKHIEEEFNLKFVELDSYHVEFDKIIKGTKNKPIAYFSRMHNGGKEVDNKHINTLMLSSCGLTKIPELVYSLKSLDTLLLANNKIKEVSSAIANLQYLSYLNLSHNQIEKLPEILFRASDYLKLGMMGTYTFDFSFNKIERIPITNESYYPIVNETTRSHAENSNEKNIYLIGNDLKRPSLSALKEDAYAISDYYEIHKEYETADIISNKKNKIQPYCVKGISINNYQGLNDISLQNIPIDTQWIFITGENGYGKTSLLQSIVIGFLGNEDDKSIINKEGEIVLEYKNKEENIVNKVTPQKDFADDFQDFAAYGPARLIKNPKYINESKTASLFNSYSELLDIEDKLEKWENDTFQGKYFKSAKKVLLKLLENHISNIKVEREGSKIQVKYEENNSTYKPFEQLASGYKSIITLVGDIMIRLLENQPEITDFKELAGIVLIDEIDLHLHPKWQKAMVKNLTELFPKIQFIASTHSPIPLLGAPENTVIINVKKTENKIVAEKLNIDFTTLTPNSILTSPIFWFREIIASGINDISKLKTEDNFNDILFNNEVERRLMEFVENNK